MVIRSFVNEWNLDVTYRTMRLESNEGLDNLVFLKRKVICRADVFVAYFLHLYDFAVDVKGPYIAPQMVSLSVTNLGIVKKYLRSSPSERRDAISILSRPVLALQFSWIRNSEILN